MPKRIPITAASAFGEKFNCKQVVILAFDGERTHIVTWGKTKADCAAARIAQDWWNGKVFPRAGIPTTAFASGEDEGII